MGTWAAIKAIIELTPQLIKLIVHIGTIMAKREFKDLVNESCEIAKLQETAKTGADNAVILARVASIWKRT